MRSFWIAVQFLTRLPVPWPRRPATAADMPGAAALFPWVGCLIGLFTAGVIWAATHGWPILLAVLLGLVAEALLTGALHEDAVGDFFDAFGGGWTREDMLRIMKDSRLGSYGALALVFAVGLRTGSLTHLDGQELFAASICAAGAGRFMSLLFMAILPAASSGLAGDVGRAVGAGHVAIGALGLLPAVAFMAWRLPEQTAFAIVLTSVLGAWFYRTLKRRLGGSTGDALGCLCYLTQVAVLLAAVSRPP